MQQAFEISITGETPAQSQRLAQELSDQLRLVSSDLSVERTKGSTETMDLGATIVLIVGSAAASAVAQGIRIWLAKRQEATIEISKDGKVKAKGLTSADALRIAEIIVTSK